MFSFLKRKKQPKEQPVVVDVGTLLLCGNALVRVTRLTLSKDGTTTQVELDADDSYLLKNFEFDADYGMSSVSEMMRAFSDTGFMSAVSLDNNNKE